MTKNACAARGELYSPMDTWNASVLPAFLAWTQAGGKLAQRIKRHVARSHESIGRRIDALGRTTAVDIFDRLRSRGMALHALGIDLTALQLDDASADPDVAAALTLLGLTTPLEKHLIRCDVPLQRSSAGDRCAAASARAHSAAADGGANGRPKPSVTRHALSRGQLQQLTASERRMFRALREDGVAFVHDWGLDRRALARQAAARLAVERAEPNWPLTSRKSLPALEPLLHNSSVARVISAYLGGPARFDSGYTLIRYPAHFNASREFPAGQWHHDRCGRRLKLFVYVEDVSEEAHPTQVAAGTHNLVWYTYGEPWQLISRYSDAYVRSQHNVISLVGRAGGGFIFDTNALHQGLLRGSAPRTVVILEFHPHGKVGPLLPFNNPCPSAKRDQPMRTWLNGLSGYKLFPTETLDPKALSMRATAHEPHRDAHR